ncbi:MAG: MBL fold metallo-hydrolase [Clostridia bacterium]|nr:MBL fold metallo-hydrolase [Clostridia bacterium]
MIKCFSGYLNSNVYLVYDKGEGMIIDCGCPVNEIQATVNRLKIEVKYIVLSHGHYDHVCYINEYINAFPNATLFCHTYELKVLRDMEANVSVLFGDPRVYNQEFSLLNEGDTLSVGELKFSILLTPGHTPGSICLLCEDKKILFTGDVLFKDGWGRTDFKYGDYEKMGLSLKRLMGLDPEIVFYSGHGPESKIKYEIY